MQIEMNSKCFLDTSVFANASIKVGADNAAALALITKYIETQLPCYALREFKEGVLAYHFWLFQKLRETGTYSGAMDGIVRLMGTLQRNRSATAARALSDLFLYFTTLELTVPVNEIDSTMGRIMQIELKKKIVRSWQERDRLARTVQPLYCFPIEDLVYDNHRLNIGNRKCKMGDECCAGKLMKGDVNKIKKALIGLRGAPPKRETTRRRDILRVMMQRVGYPVDKKSCRDIGDAYFVVMCPEDCDLLTTNVVDIQPMADAIGVNVVCP